MTMLRLTCAMLAVLLAPIGGAHGQDDCRHEAERTASVDAAGAELLEIVARAGRLVVEGRERVTEVGVRGRACASDETLLDAIQLMAERRNDTVRIEALMPESEGWWGEHYARLDLVLEVPAGIVADIRDGSGEIEARALGAVALVDGSGSIELEDLRGSVRIEDGSGSIYVARSGGDVTIHDGSGEIRVRGVEGAVEVTDGSGAIEVTDVSGNVTVRRDGSGSIHVEDVGGDFIVELDGSGGVSHENVRGAVRLPYRS